MTLNMPSVAVSVDFTHDPMSGSFTWTDLTKRSWNFTVTRGRTYELTQVQAGTAKVTMENIDGALDPTNTASPYSPNVMVFRRLKIEATWNGVLHAVYAGLVERWPMEWQDNLSVSPVECTDVFAILANKDLPSAVVGELLNDSPMALYPMNDPTGSSSAGDVSGSGAVATVMASKERSTGTYNFTGAGLSLVGSGVDGYSLQVTGLAGITHNFTTLAVTFQTTASVLQQLYVENDFYILLDASGHLVAGSAIGGVTGTRVLNDGNEHTVEVRFTVGLGVYHSLAYVDGTLEVDGGGPYAGDTVAYVGGFQSTGVHGFPPTQGPYFTGTVSNYARYNTLLSTGRVSTHWAAATTAFAGESADARILRLLTYAGWIGPTAIDACSTTVTAATGIAGQKALSAIQSVATTEGGTFFVARDGTLTYQSRRTRMVNVTPVAVFGDGPGELPYESLSFDYDPTYVYNDIAITRSAASSASATDATSAGHYGPRSLPVQMDMTSDTEISAAASWLLASYKDPHVRVSGITLHPSAVSDPAMWTACLSLEIGSRVTVKRRPKGTTNPNPISGDYFVEQVSITSWTADDATFRLALSPIPIQALIADDPTFGICDSIYVAAW